MTERELLLLIVDCAFDKRSWHGPNLRSSMRGISAAQASAQIKNRKTIWQQALHSAYWKQRVANRLGSKQKLPWAGKNWMLPPGKQSDAAWREDLKQIEKVHRRFRQALQATSEMDEKTLWMVIGAALHDIYHAGQINGLKRMLK